MINQLPPLKAPRMTAKRKARLEARKSITQVIDYAAGTVQPVKWDEALGKLVPSGPKETL